MNLTSLKENPLSPSSPPLLFCEDQRYRKERRRKERKREYVKKPQRFHQETDPKKKE